MTAHGQALSERSVSLLTGCVPGVEEPGPVAVMSDDFDLHFLMNHVEHLLMCLLGICMSEKCLLRSFPCC